MYMEELKLKAHCLILISGIRYYCKIYHLQEVSECICFWWALLSPSLKELGETQTPKFVFLIFIFKTTFLQNVAF